MDLDVGCGWNPKGDVNVDLFLRKPIPEREDEQTHYLDFKRAKATTAKLIENFVLADSNHLPFRANIFDEVLCDHLLEHKGVDLVQTSRELVRVCCGVVKIWVPSEFVNMEYTRKHGSCLHDKILTPETFHILFRNFKRRVKYSRRRWFLVRFPTRLLTFWVIRLPDWLPCPIPTEIKVEVNKR